MTSSHSGHERHDMTPVTLRPTCQDSAASCMPADARRDIKPSGCQWVAISTLRVEALTLERAYQAIIG